LPDNTNSESLTETLEITALSKYPPIDTLYLNQSDKEKSYPNLGVYCNSDIELEPSNKLAIILTGFTCAGKDTVMEELESTGKFFHVITATSRPRRVEKNEPEDKYVWLDVREKSPDETVEDYIAYVKEECGLIEADYHYGNVYGLPLVSLQREGSGIPVIRPDINGTETLVRELPKYGFQPLSIAVMPDSWEQIYQIIMKERGGNMKRLEEDLENIDKYIDPNIIDYYIHNSRYDYGDMTGLERSIAGIMHMLEQLNK
jgi:guanylate kinase